MRWLALIAFCACASTTPAEQQPPSQQPRNEAQDAVMNTVLGHKRDLMTCAEEQHRRDPSVKGKLVVSWVVMPGGYVSDVKIISRELAETYFANCISTSLTTWTFPPAAELPEPIVFPFAF